MSLILDALKRAERDRRSERSAALEELPASHGPRTGRRWGRWLGLALLTLVIVAMTASVVRQRSKRAPTVAAAAVTAAPRPAAPVPQTTAPAQAPAGVRAPTPAPVPVRPAPVVIPGTEGVASLDDLTLGTTEDLPPATTPPPQAAAPEAQPPPAETEREAEAEAAAEAEVATRRPAEPALAEETPPAIPPALTQRAPVRKLREMPPDYRADFPALTVEVHVFEPGRRFVMVNGRRYREGERLAEGPQVVEIVRDGIVLEYRGEKVLFTLGR